MALTSDSTFSFPGCITVGSFVEIFHYPYYRWALIQSHVSSELAIARRNPGEFLRQIILPVHRWAMLRVSVINHIGGSILHRSSVQKFEKSIAEDQNEKRSQMNEIQL